MSVDFIFKKCPNCSANLKFIPGEEMGQCEFCGSSFMISTLNSQNDNAEETGVKTMEFNPDWAKKISELALKRFREKHKIDLSKESNAMTRITEVSRKVAMELEDQEKATMNLPFITATSNGPLHIIEEYTRSDLE